MFSTFFFGRTLLPFRGGSAGDESKFPPVPAASIMKKLTYSPRAPARPMLHSDGFPTACLRLTR